MIEAPKVCNVYNVARYNIVFMMFKVTIYKRLQINYQEYDLI